MQTTMSNLYLQLIVTIATVGGLVGCGKVDSVPPTTPAPTASSVATIVVPAPGEKEYTFNFYKGVLQLGNRDNVMFALGKDHGSFAEIRRDITTLYCNKDWQPDTLTASDLRNLTKNVEGLASQQFAVVRKLTVTMAADPSSPILTVNGACYGTRGKDGKWTWRRRGKPMRYDEAAQTYTAQLDIDTPGPIDAIKIVSSADNSLSVTNITYTVVESP
jgi:hypothetical protein